MGDGRSCLDDYALAGKLGTGTFGVVWKVVRKADKQTYALKEVDLGGLSRKEQEDCVREVHVLARMDCPYIIKYYDCFMKDAKLYIVTEYAPGGTLHEYVTKNGATGLPEHVVWRLLIQMALALQHMHHQRVLHRDIKSLNVFLGQKGVVKLGDLGVAKVLSTQTNCAQTLVGTPFYLSPELCQGQAYNDRWALGIVLYECCTGQHPFDADNEGALVMRILRGKYAPVPASKYTAELRDIIAKCLSLSSKSRPSCDTLLGLAAVQSKARELKLDIPAPAQTAGKVKAAAKAGAKKATSAATPNGKSCTTGSNGKGTAAGTPTDAIPASTEVATLAEDDKIEDESGVPTSLEHLKQQVVGMVGLDKYAQVHKCIQEQWAKDRDSNSNDQDLAAAVQQLLPKQHEEVMGLMCRILLQEMHAG